MQSKINYLLKEAKATFYTATNIQIVVTLPKADYEKVEQEIRDMCKDAITFNRVLDKVQEYNTLITQDGQIKFKADGE